MERNKKKSLKEYLKDINMKRKDKKSEFMVVYSQKEEPKYEGFITPKIAKFEKSEKKLSSLKESIKKEKKEELFEKKYEFEIKNIEELIYEKKTVLFNFVASYFLFLDLSSISKVTKEMPYGEPFPVEWFQGESIIGEPLAGGEKYEFFIGRDGRTFMYLKGIGDKFEKIASVIKYIVEQEEKGLDLIEKYGKDIIVFANSIKKDPSLNYEECIPEDISPDEKALYEEMFFRILGKKKVEIEEKKEEEPEEEIIQGITFKPLLKKLFIGNPFGILYSSFPEIKELYENYGDRIHTFVNDFSQILLHHNLCFDSITWKEVEEKFTYLKTKIIPKILKDVKAKYKEEYEKFVIKAQRLKSFIRKNIKEKEERLIKIIDFVIAVYILRKWYETTKK